MVPALNTVYPEGHVLQSCQKKVTKHAFISLCKLPLGFMLSHNTPNDEYQLYENKSSNLELHDGFGILGQAVWGQRFGAFHAKRRTIPMSEHYLYFLASSGRSVTRTQTNDVPTHQEGLGQVDEMTISLRPLQGDAWRDGRVEVTVALQCPLVVLTAA